MTASTWLRRRLRLRAQGDAATACARQRRAFDRAALLVRVYYAATLYLVAVELPQWQKWSEARALAPFWPVAWIELVGIGPGVHLVMSFAIAAALAAAVAPTSRRTRFLAAVALLELIALSYSFGGFGSGWGQWLWAAFLFVLLPNGVAGDTPARARRQSYLTVFWAAQLMIFGSFALSGAWKVAYAAVQIAAGEVHMFAPSAMARHVASQLHEAGRTSLLGPAIIDNPVLGWLPLVGVLYLQLGAIAAAFRPTLHQIWAVALIAFHLATTVVLAMNFPRSVLLLAILCAASPFAPAEIPWRRAVCDAPLVGAVLSRIRRGGLRRRGEGAGAGATREAH